MRFNLDVIDANIEMVGEELFSQSHYYGPTLFIRGSASGYIKNQDWDNIQYHFPEATLETIENAGHWVHAEQPKEFYNKMFEFLMNLK